MVSVFRLHFSVFFFQVKVNIESLHGTMPGSGLSRHCVFVLNMVVLAIAWKLSLSANGGRL
jgi:hypothetical protein